MTTRQQRRHGTGQTRNRKTWWFVAAGVLLVAAIIAFAFVPGRSGSANPPAPDVTLGRFDGTTMRISDLTGTPHVVNFWASWCVPCQAEMPGFEQVYQRHRDRVGFLGINLADDPTAAMQVVARTGITYPLAQDLNGDAFTAFGAIGMPTTVFLDADGGVIEVYSGEMSADQLEQRVQRYFLSS